MKKILILSSILPILLFQVGCVEKNPELCRQLSALGFFSVKKCLGEGFEPQEDESAQFSKNAPSTSASQTSKEPPAKATPSATDTETEKSTFTNPKTGEDVEIPLEDFLKMTRQEFAAKMGISDSEISEEEFQKVKILEKITQEMLNSLKNFQTPFLAPLEKEFFIDDELQEELIRACWIGDLNKIEKLIFSGALIDVANRAGETALGMAVEMQEPEVVRFLLDHGADPNQTHKGSSVLLLAQKKGSEDIVNLLKDSGATE